MNPLNTTQKIILSFVAIVLAIIIAFVFMASFYGYQIIDGRLVGMNYTAAQSGLVVAAGSTNPGTAQVFTPEKFTLIIDVNGQVSAYSVNVHTYGEALTGKTIFKMKCNKISCIVVEQDR